MNHVLWRVFQQITRRSHAAHLVERFEHQHLLARLGEIAARG